MPTNEEAMSKHHGLWGQAPEATKVDFFQTVGKLKMAPPRFPVELEWNASHRWIHNKEDYKTELTVRAPETKGDSGSPYIADHHLKNTPVQLGLVSFSTGRCGVGYPSVFTHVGSYLPWIKHHTGISG
ncbi:hypothetical protein FOCC_FOCC010947 [Frankliniella occidentalis]|nr:hypothetical protein FOCC_FOCC010947 [Frankliniella occidentalis]